jgi:GT2 family glycosyltransferase
VKEFLKKCLESVYKFAQGVEFEVFVVDNNSSDGSQDMVRAEFPQVRLIANNENYGFSKANNQALKLCGGRYILLLNPDTELIDNSPKAMAEFMDNQPGIDAIGCKLIYPEGDVQHSCRHFPSLFTDLMENLYLDALFQKSPFFNYYRMGDWAHNEFRQVDQPYGACLLFRQEVMKKIGLMDERFFMYYDEVDLCYRIKKSGGKIYFVPGIQVIHYANRSSNQISVTCEHYKYRSKFLFFDKHYGRWSIFILTLSLILRSILAGCVFPVLHVVCGRPRDEKYFKRYLRIIWSEYLRFWNSH